MHLCKCILITPAEKSRIAQKIAVALDARFGLLTGAMQKT